MTEKNSSYRIFNQDCLVTLSIVPDSYIDCIITDLPYGITQNKWDKTLDLDELWYQYNRILKPGGNIILFASQPFTSELVLSNREMFRYEIIWEKTIGSGQLNIKKSPLKVHESVLIFHDKGKSVYNEQLTEGKPYQINRKASFKGNYGEQTENHKVNDGYRHARSVLKFSNPRIKGGHPTEKPVELLRHLVRTYSNKGDIILDSCMGCGSTGVSALLEGRKFIGMEVDRKYYDIAREKLFNIHSNDFR